MEIPTKEEEGTVWPFISPMPPTQRSRRLWALGLAFVAFLLALVAGGAYSGLQGARADLYAWFAQENLDQLETTSAQVRESIQDVADDLAFAETLLHATDQPGEEQRTLRALLGSVRAYQLARIYERDGSVRLAVTDPRRPFVTTDAISSALDNAANAVLVDINSSALYTSPPLVSAEQHWYRIFASVLQPTPTHAGGVLVLLVDVHALVAPLQRLAISNLAELALWGPHGELAPVTTLSPQAVKALTADAAGPLGAALARVTGSAGTWLGQPDLAQAIGLKTGRIVMCWAEIPVEESRPWRAVTFTSTGALQAREKELVGQMVSLALGVGLGVLLVSLLVLGLLLRAQSLREQLNTAAELGHLREKASKILQNIPSPVFAATADGRLMAINGASQAFITDPAAGPVTIDAAFADAGEKTQAHIADLLRLAVAGGPPAALRSVESSLFHAGDSFSIQAVPLQPGAPDARALLVLNDLTELRGLQSQVLRMEKMATVGGLAAGIAHEVGTPLGVIRGRAEYVLRKLGPDHAQANGLTVIVEQIDRVVRTIRTLLDYARPKPVAPIPIPLAELAGKVEDLLRWECDRRKMTLSIQIPQDLPPLAAEPDALEQVLVNLIMNALDAGSAAGQVTLRAHRIENRVRIEVHDDGQGIPPEHLNRIFDPFFTTKKRGQGTGLGLAVVNLIARDHGASIEVTSQPGHGTTMRLDWPNAQQENPHEHPSPSHDSGRPPGDGAPVGG